jgi:hypothetical protein
MQKTMILRKIQQTILEELGLSMLGFNTIESEISETSTFFARNYNEDMVNVMYMGFVVSYEELFFSSTTTYFSSSKRVNNILNFILYQHDSDRYRMFYPTPTLRSIPDSYPCMDTLMEAQEHIFFRNGVLDEGELRAGCQSISNHWQKYAFPFFEKVDSIQFVNDEIINKIPQMELHKYLGGPFIQFTKLIIMKLCKNHEYDNYCNWMQLTYENAIPKDPDRLMPQYKIFQDLRNLLDSGEYLQILENNNL